MKTVRSVASVRHACATCSRCKYAAYLLKTEARSLVENDPRREMEVLAQILGQSPIHELMSSLAIEMDLKIIFGQLGSAPLDDDSLSALIEDL